MSSISQRPLIIPIFIPHAGCPHQCVFCNQKIITGTAGELTGASIAEVIGGYLKYKRPSRSHVEVSFYGGNFLGLPKNEFLRLLNETLPFIDSKKIDSIRFSTRPDTIDENRLNLIRSYPVSTIELGVQSMDDRVLDLSNRGHTAENTVAAVSLLKKRGYHIGLQMMIGLPGDTAPGSVGTAEKIIGLNPDFVRIYPTLVLKGSPLAVWYKQGRYTPMLLQDCVLEMKSLYFLFKTHRIPVIRMGLQASEELNDRSIVLAGPYHPALGHMVLSEVMLDNAMDALRAKKPSSAAITLKVHPKSLSRMQGLQSCNLDKIKRELGIRTVHIKTDNSLAADEVRVVKN